MVPHYLLLLLVSDDVFPVEVEEPTPDPTPTTGDQTGGGGAGVGWIRYRRPEKRDNRRLIRQDEELITLAVILTRVLT